MVITRTPLRISFFGGGTDYPEHYRAHGGAVLSSSIDRYVYLTVASLSPLFDHTIRVAYSRTELVRSVDEIQHPSVRECLRFLGIEGGVEISVTADIPARTGLGSSSSFTVGLLHALHALRGEMASREQLAEEAIHVEQRLIRERVGSQDQVAAARGGLNRIYFSDDPEFQIDPLPISRGRRAALEARLMMVFTGISRAANDVLDEQCRRTGENREALAAMRAQVDEAARVLCDERTDLRVFGEMLDHGWRLKRGLSSMVSNDAIDRAYSVARERGAIGGKLLGAGSGGFILLFAEPEDQPRILEALPGMPKVDFALENTGSRVIYLLS